MAEPAAYAFMPRRKRDIGDDEYPDISDTASEDDEEEVGVTANSPSLPVECTRDIKLVEPASQEKCVLLKLASVWLKPFLTLQLSLHGDRHRKMMGTDNLRCYTLLSWRTITLGTMDIEIISLSFMVT